MKNISESEKALIHFAIIYLKEEFKEDLLERFRDTHLTDELSEQLDGKETMDQVELIVKKLEKLKTKIYHQADLNNQTSDASQLADDDQLELVNGLFVLKPATMPIAREAFDNLVHDDRYERIQKILNNFEIY